MSETLLNQNQIQESWTKPSQWVDIRSGAVSNSIYFLVGHSADYSNYRKFALTAKVSSGTYDVYVDGIKQASTATNTATELDWQTLALTSGWDVTYPAALRTHVVRVTPTTATETLTAIRIYPVNDQVNQGCLWMHFALDNAIFVENLAGTASSLRSLILEAVTAKNNKITYTVNANNSGFYGIFAYCSSLVEVPVLEAENRTRASGTYLSFVDVPAKKIVIKNNHGGEGFGMFNQTKVHEFDVEYGVTLACETASLSSGRDAANLKKLPVLNTPPSDYSNTTFFATNYLALKDTVIHDASELRTKFVFKGTSSNFVAGLKGVTVSSSAPFTGSSPQIDVSYTGLDRAALINLFNSLPTVTDSQVCDVTATTGAADLTAGDLAIATGKGWSIVR